MCPKLRELATAPAGGITQPRTNFFGQLCSECSVSYPMPPIKEKKLEKHPRPAANPSAVLGARPEFVEGRHKDIKLVYSDLEG